MVKVTAYLVVAGTCSVVHDSKTADDSIISRVIASSIINDECRFVGSVSGTKVYSTECDQTEDECWVLAVGEELSHEEIAGMCKDQQHIIWKPRSLSNESKISLIRTIVIL